ncbi:MAG: ABC-F family ATP-binding cassette domain-containing protein [Bacteriovoracaceae bacterium]
MAGPITLCSLQNLHLHYPHKVIFRDATFVLNEGDKIGVLGLNGHGKTSLFKLMTGEVVPDTTVPPCLFDKSKDFSYFTVPQELPLFEGVTAENYLYYFYPEFKQLKTRLDEVGEMLGSGEGDFEKLLDEQTKIYEELEKKEADKIVNQYLSFLRYFGLKGMERAVESLSGGEQRKIALALGLSAPQKIILWDEPTNHLDLETIELFEEELMKTNKTFMLITHDRYLLNNVVEKIVHIQHGKIKSFQGTYAEYLTFLQEEDKRREKELDKLSNYHRRESAWIMRGAKARRTKSKKRIEDYSSLSSAISELKNLAHKSVNLSLQSSGRKTKILFEATEIGLTFGERELFKNLSFTVAKGDKIALIGNNGVGKSSILKILQGTLDPTTGKVKRADNLRIGFFSQKREQLDPEKTPWDIVGEGMDFVVSTNGIKRHVASYLESFLFNSEELRRPIKTFSGGEKNRLQLAQFMKDPADIWIFDEPTNDLDLETIGILEEELKNYDGALIIVGHDRAFIENVSGKCWLLADKRIENFEAGYSQVEPYLEALKLEKDLAKMAAPKGTNSKEKLNYNEKKRLETIQAEIEQQETLVSSLQNTIDNFNYSEMGPEKSAELVKTQSQLDEAKIKLEKIFEEWTELESKQ